jgi:hypothetical protein
MQPGRVLQSSRKLGPDVWFISLVRKNHNARRLYRKRVIGTVEDYPDEVTVRQAASGLLSDVNLRIRHDRNVCISIDQLWSIATQKTYRGYIRRWIRPRWGSRSLDDIKAVEVEAWLRGLNLARASRAKIRNVFVVIFSHACRYELFGRNPMRFVRQSAKRRRAPDVLTGAEIKVLVENLRHARSSGSIPVVETR